MIFKLVQKIERNVGKKDLHSFTGSINGGVVHVTADYGGVYVEHQKTDCCDWVCWVGTAIAAANRLEMLGLNLESVEI